MGQTTWLAQGKHTFAPSPVKFTTLETKLYAGRDRAGTSLFPWCSFFLEVRGAPKVCFLFPKSTQFAAGPGHFLGERRQRITVHSAATMRAGSFRGGECRVGIAISMLFTYFSVQDSEVLFWGLRFLRFVVRFLRGVLRFLKVENRA